MKRYLVPLLAVSLYPLLAGVMVLAASFVPFQVAKAQPISTPAVTTNLSIVITAGNTFQQVMAALVPPAQRRSLTIQNNNTTTDNCWVYVGSGSATKGASILLLPAGAYTRYFPYVPSDVIQATCASTSNTIYVDVQ